MTNLTPAEQECEHHFRATYSWNAQRGYIVPFKSQVEPELGDSRTNASYHLMRLERRLNKDTLQQAAYHEFMREYETLGHMTRISETKSASTGSYYFPHHAVM